jgi:hypothetical protein
MAIYQAGITRGWLVGVRHAAKRKDRRAYYHAYFEMHRQARLAYGRSWHRRNRAKRLRQMRVWYRVNHTAVLARRKALRDTERVGTLRWHQERYQQPAEYAAAVREHKHAERLAARRENYRRRRR